MIRHLLIAAGLLLCVASPARQPAGPDLEALEAAAADTDFIWYGYFDHDWDERTVAETILFVATDSSWLLFEHGGEVSTLGPRSEQPAGGPTRSKREPLGESLFAQQIAARERRQESYCNDYETIRASVQAHWEARRLWQGEIAMQAPMRLELFNAPTGEWALLVHEPEAGDRACVAMHGFGSRWVQVAGSRD